MRFIKIEGKEIDVGDIEWYASQPSETPPGNDLQITMTNGQSCLLRGGEAEEALRILRQPGPSKRL